MMMRLKDQRPPRQQRLTSNPSRRHGGGRSSLLSPGDRRAPALGYPIRPSPRLIVTLQAGEDTSKRTSTQRQRCRRRRRRWKLRVSWRPCNCARRWPSNRPPSCGGAGCGSLSPNDGRPPSRGTRVGGHPLQTQSVTFTVVTQPTGGAALLIRTRLPLRRLRHGTRGAVFS